MPKFVFLISLFSLVLYSSCSPFYLSFATDKQYANKYADQMESNSEVLKTWYHYTLEKLPNETYIYKQFYPETRQMTHFYTYSDLKKTKNGKSIEWYDNGHKRWEGNYLNDKKEGEWQEFSFKNGRLIRKGLYHAGMKEGKWIELDSTGTTRATFFYKNGQKDGGYKVFDEEGKLVSEGWYEKNKLIEKEKVKAVQNKPDLIQQTPFLTTCKNEDAKEQQMCSDKTLLTAIYKNLNYPTLARERQIEGTAIVHFVVEKDGQIAEVEVLRGLCKEIKATCINTLTYIPDWSPGMRDGEAVRVSFFLPMKFRL